MSLQGRRVLVVGGGGDGIGSAVVHAVADAGADVAAVTVDADHLAATIAEVETRGRRAFGVALDVADLPALGAAVDELGPFDGLVTVVGGATVPHWHRLLDYPIESFDHLISTNLRYVLVAAQHVARQAVAEARPASIVTISSIASRGAPLLAGYAAAKAGLDALTKTMAAEWGRYGIRVNGVAPGTVNTPRAGRSDLVDEASRAIPLGRRGAPGDIANATLFLLSDLAAYITGHVLVVDGGASVRSGDLDEHDLPRFVTNPAIRARFDGSPLTPRRPDHSPGAE